MLFLAILGTSTDSFGYAPILTAAAGVMTAAIGYLAFRLDRKSRQLVGERSDWNNAASVIRAEHEGWTALISDLRTQVADGVKQRNRLSVKLETALQAQDDLREELSGTRAELVAVRATLDELQSRLERRRSPQKPRSGGKRSDDPA